MAIISILLFILLVGNACADVMNLNEFMPTRMEDSTVTQPHAFEFQLSSDLQKEKVESDEVIFRGNVRYGLSDRLQLETFATPISGGSESGSGEIQMGGQYNLIPEIALSPMIVLPSGKNADGIDTHLRLNHSLTLLGTTNTPRAQIHLNVDWTHNNKPHKDERSEHFLYLVGISYKYNDSSSVLLNIYREEEEVVETEINVIELGTQFQLQREYMIGLGAGIGLGDESPHWNGILSLVKKVDL